MKALNYGAFPFNPVDIDTVLLTHAHIDHSGLLPKLVRQGFRGRIVATRGTIDLCSYLLPDAGSIQESEVETLNRRNAARGRGQVEPIYTKADAVAALDSFRPVVYETWFEAGPDVRARYWNAGHLLGSASIELEFSGTSLSDQLWWLGGLGGGGGGGGLGGGRGGAPAPRLGGGVAGGGLWGLGPWPGGAGSPPPAVLGVGD